MLSLVFVQIPAAGFYKVCTVAADIPLICQFAAVVYTCFDTQRQDMLCIDTVFTVGWLTANCRLFCRGGKYCDGYFV